MSTSAPIDTSPPFFKSLSALRRAHTSLLEEYQKYDDDKDGNIPPGSFFEQVETFLSRASKTGSVLDIDEDRSDAQTLLNYWTTVLYDSDQTPRPTLLAKFDEQLVSREIGAGCPYRGLRAFQKEDRAVFYGRRRLTRDMSNLLGSGNFLAVVGLSGSGKSSIVRAGLIPALQEGALTDSESWTYYDPIVPGPEPIRSLAELARPADFPAEQWYQKQVSQFKHDDAHLLKLVSGTGETAVVIVDQFEELFTLSRDDAERHAFVANLVRLTKASDPRHIVIITMRSEFDTYVARFPELQELFDVAQVRVPPLSPQDLRKAIEKPAERSGLSFEAGLVEELVQEVLGEPAGLPLLQFTLYKLWENRDGKNITRAIYDQLGGSPREILAGVANTTYETFKLIEDRNISRRIMLRLVRPGAGLDVTSNRVRRATLSSVGARDNFDRVLGAWVKAGLLRVTPGATPDDDQVEVMHEALIRNWPLLVAWLEEERVHLRKRLQLTSAAQQWVEHRRDAGGLLGGTLLAEALTYDDLNDLETEFVEASKEAALAAEQDKKDREQRLIAARRLQLRLASVFLVVALGLLAWAIWKTQAAASATTKQNEALHNLVITQSKLQEDTEKSRLAIQAARNETAQQLIDLEKNIETKTDELESAQQKLDAAHSKVATAEKIARESVSQAEQRLTKLQDEITELNKQKVTLEKQKDKAEKTAESVIREIDRYAVPAERVVVSSVTLGLRGLVRPLRPGLSIGSLSAGSTSSGSLCCVVRDSSGRRYLLSANHILGNHVGDSVIQPGWLDKGTEENKVGTLARVDETHMMALAELLPGIEFTTDIPDGRINGTSDQVKQGDLLFLIGRTSGWVKGKVISVNSDIRMGGPGDAIRILHDVITTEKVSGPGDSGAPVFDQQGRLVGVVVGGSTTTSIIIPIRQILRALDVELEQ